MKNKLIIMIAIILSSAASAETRTVGFVDVSRYLGTWYEIASIPQWFSKGCYCTRAEYSLRKSNTLDVLNTCNKKSIDGKLSEANGVAKIADTKTNAKLKVSFFWPFKGDYWVIGLAEDYRYAVVSNKEGSTLWILSRTPQMSTSDLNETLAIVQTNGVDASKLKFTEQEGCFYP